MTTGQVPRNRAAASHAVLACRALRAATAGLVMLVLLLAPLHRHEATQAPTGTCLLCEIGQRTLDLPAAVAAVAPSLAAPVSDAASDPRETPRADDSVLSPFAPRGPPPHS